MKQVFAILIVGLTCLSAHANVVGVDTQNFNPTTSGLDFVTVQSSETLEPGIVNFGLFFNYAINTLPNYLDTTTQSRTKARDKLLSSDVNLGLGLLPGWDVGISFPAVLNQEVEADVLKGVFNKTGMTDIRLNTKYKLSGDKDHGTAVIFTLELPQVENNPFYGNSTSPTYDFEFAADTTWNKVAVGGNIGYRVRQTGPAVAGVPISPIGNMYIASLAASYLFTNIDTKLISEIFSSFPTEQTATQTDRELMSAEWLLGVKHDVSNQLALHAGVSTGIVHGTFTPDWRVYAGLNWTMGPLWGRHETPVAEKTMHAVPPVAPSHPIDETPAIPPAQPMPEPSGNVTEVTTVNQNPDQGDYFAGHQPEKQELFVVRNINFRSGSNKVPVDFRDYLEKLATYLNRKPVFKRLVVSGHTDSVGKHNYNVKLSRARAATVKQALVELFHIPASKIQTEGFGPDRPIADNGNYQGREQNRRVEFFIER